VAGVQTQVGGRVATVTDSLRATVSAAASPLTGTVSAAATQVANRVGGAVATSTAQSTIDIIAVQPGTTPTITVRNSGAESVDLSGWIVMLGVTPTLVPVTRDARIGPGEQVLLHFGAGTNARTDISLDQAQADATNNLKSGGWVALVTLRSGIASIYQIP
jgi:hypothetical protein